MKGKLMKWSVYGVGIFILALGVTLMLLSNLGAGGWDALTSNMSQMFNIKIGSALFILAGSLLLGAALIERKILSPMPFLVSFVTGKFIDFWYYFIFGGTPFQTFSGRVAMVSLGVLAIALGCSLMFITELPKNHTETFVFAVAEKLKISYKTAKTAADSSALAIALIFGFIIKDFSNLGLGTVLNTFFTGYLIHMINPFVKKIYSRIME